MDFKSKIGKYHKMVYKDKHGPYYWKVYDNIAPGYSAFLTGQIIKEHNEWIDSLLKYYEIL